MKKANVKWIVRITLISLVTAAVFTFASTEVLGHTGYIVSFAILAVFVVIGIVFDIIGIAVAAAHEAPFNSMAARRQRGAAEALRLIKNANKVTCYCNDVIGDVTGIVSGTTAALIAARLMEGIHSSTLLFPIVISAVVTALTVGGKAIGKTLAFDKSTEIVFAAGKLLSLTRISPFSAQVKQEKQEKQENQEKNHEQ